MVREKGPPETAKDHKGEPGAWARPGGSGEDGAGGARRMLPGGRRCLKDEGRCARADHKGRVQKQGDGAAGSLLGLGLGRGSGQAAGLAGPNWEECGEPLRRARTLTHRRWEAEEGLTRQGCQPKDWQY